MPAGTIVLGVTAAANDQVWLPSFVRNAAFDKDEIEILSAGMGNTVALTLKSWA